MIIGPECRDEGNAAAHMRKMTDCKTTDCKTFD